jgi:hypothetical protein
MTTTIEYLLREVRALSPEDQQQFRRLLDSFLPSPQAASPATEERFQQQLMAAGLLREIKRPPAALVSLPRPPRVTLQGPPLSTTIVEERR